MLYGIILVIHLLACLILIAVILLQAGRGGGFSDTFGGGAAQSLFGTRGTVYLTRATTLFAILFMSTSIGLSVLSLRRGRSLMEQLPTKTPLTKKPTPEPIKTQAPAQTPTPTQPTQPETPAPQKDSEPAKE